jgi:hypothetical protein
MKASKFSKKLVCVLSAAVLFGCVFCGPAVAGDAVLETVPAGCVFCVRLNNFDYTLGQFDMFLSSASPMAGASMMVRGQLMQILGDPGLQGLDTTGSFAIFGTAQGAAGAEPNIFTAALLPVKDYQKFLELSPNVGKADDAGVSTIKYSAMAAPGMQGPQKVLLCVKAGRFAAIGPEEKRAQLIELAKAGSSAENSMAKQVDADQSKLSADMPIWAYCDIEQVNKAFAAKIEEAFTKAEKELKGVSCAPGKAPMGGLNEIMKVYMDMAKAFLQQGKYASVTLKPEPSVLRIHNTLTAKPGTEMAELLTADATLPKENKLLAQLGDGAAITAAAKINKAWMEKLTRVGMSFMKAGSTGDPNAAAETARWEQLCKDNIDSMGQVLAASVKGNPGAKPPFVVEYIVEIKDKEKYNKVFDESAQLMKTGAFSQMYKNMGIETAFDVKRGTGEYNGVTIDSAKLTMKVIDVNSPQAQMIQAMYGDGFDYRMAQVNGLQLMAVGGDPDATIKKMIDSVKAADRQLSPEITAAMSLLGETREADFMGTLNYIRLMSMVMGFMPTPMPIPFDQIPTKSNIAFSGRVADGKLVADVVVPKEHVMEIQTGMQMLMQQQMQQMQQQQQQQQNEPQPGQLQ